MKVREWISSRDGSLPERSCIICRIGEKGKEDRYLVSQWEPLFGETFIRERIFGYVRSLRETKGKIDKKGKKRKKRKRTEIGKKREYNKREGTDDKVWTHLSD